MKTRILMASLLTTVVLTGCAGRGNQLDTRTGKPLPASPTSPREIGLRSYTVNLFGQYRVQHAYLKGINISQCYAGAPDNDVQIVTMRWGNEETEPAYIFYHQGKQGKQPLKFMMRGTKHTNGQGDQYMNFDAFCHDRIAGGAITFGIRDSHSQAITEYLAESKQTYSRYRNARQDAPRRIVRGQNLWTYLHTVIPGFPLIEEDEVWLLPIGDSGFYFHLTFGYSIAARANNVPEYQQARRLFDQILDSIQVEKLPS